MLLPSSLPAQAPSAIGSSRIAARFADIPNCNSLSIVCPGARLVALRRILDRPPAKWNSYLGYPANVRFMKTAPARNHWGSNGASRPDIHGRGGQCGTSHARGSASAALGSGRDVLDRGLRDPVRLERAHLVSAMMADMLDMVTTHLGIGVQRIRL